MSTILRIPLQTGVPQKFSIILSGTTYQLTFLYRDIDQGGWFVDIDDNAGNPIVHGIPLVTGANLLEQYAHLGFAGGLFVQTINNPDAVPTFSNLGADGQLYWATA